jgi:hypothetical protein
MLKRLVLTYLGHDVGPNSVRILRQAVIQDDPLLDGP